LNEQGRWNIKIVEANGGQPRQLTNGPFNNHVPNWSHDGKWIYFTSDRTGRPEIWREPAAGGTAEQVTGDGGYVAVESPDGALLYYTKIGIYEGVPLYVRPLAGGEEREVLEHVMARGFAVFRDGIYYLDSTGTLTSEIRFYDFDKGRSRTVGAIDGQLGLGLSVSPDRKTFLFSRILTGSDLIMIENFQ
jgi:Tol biopolymer transport system component